MIILKASHSTYCYSKIKFELTLNFILEIVISIAPDLGLKKIRLLFHFELFLELFKI